MTNKTPRLPRWNAYSSPSILLLPLLFAAFPAWSFDAFTVEEINVEGLQRIAAGTVFTYLPVKIGETFDRDKSQQSLRALFRTGYFNDVRFSRDGGTLIVEVNERPAISKITFEGNKAIDSEDLTKALKGIGFAEGRAFDRSLLEKVELELQRQYFNQAKYGVDIRSTVTPRDRNRVDVQVDITEGKAAKIKQISIIGNQTFSERKLLRELGLSTTSWFSFLSSSDQYSREKLTADLEILRSYYLDRGFINFTVDSTQVSISPDKQDIFITINISEGKQYKVSAIALDGNLIVPEEELRKKITLQPGEIFSQKKTAESSEAITERIGDEGYAFANVNAVPEFQENEQTVTMKFFVDPGKRVYVRRINFSGNARTQDEVLRREMRQMEAGWASTEKIKRSRTRLERLGFFDEVNVETVPVEGSSDEVDVNFKVVERPSGNLLAGLGYSQNQGFMFNASIAQDNFLGTGKKVDFSFNNSQVNTIYSVSYNDPYFTIDGISQGFGLYYRETDAYEANLSRYALDVAGGNVRYGIPVNEYDAIYFGLEAEQTTLKTTDNSAREIFDFIAANGDTYKNLKFTASWSHDTRNRALFPDRGMLQSFSAEFAIPVGDLDYYKLNYKQVWYYPLSKAFTLMLKGDIAYGDGYGDNPYPFFENYTAGGPRSIRGFEENTLGPKDSLGYPFGGNFRIIGNAELFFPVPFAKETNSFRLSTFLDAGNVFGVSEDIDVSQLRYSMGVAATWYSPIGGMRFSLAKPLNSKEGDDAQVFQFTLGTAFN